MKNHKQAVFGCILGQAIGDALGHPAEFNKDLVVKGLNADNEFTDDTQMAMAVGEAVLSMPPHEMGLDAFMKEVSANFIRWDKGDPRWGPNNRAPGRTCLRGVDKLMQNTPWQKSGDLAGKGNGGPMRSSYVGAAYWKNPEYAFRIGCLTSVNTHANLEAILASGAVSFLVASSISGNRFPFSIAHCLELMQEYDTTVPAWPRAVPIGSGYSDQNVPMAIARVGQAFAFGKSELSAGDWKNFNGNDFKAMEAVAAAIFYNTRSSGYTECVLDLVNNTGDCDTTAAIGGAIAGARWGEGFIPRKWREKVERSPYLHDLAKRIYEFSEKYNPNQKAA